MVCHHTLSRAASYVNVCSSFLNTFGVLQSHTSASDDLIEQLRLKLTDTQQALKSATARAEGAEKDLQQAFDALQQAEALLTRALYRKDAAELVALAAGCIAAFLGAAGMTVYYLH